MNASVPFKGAIDLSALAPRTAPSSAAPGAGAQGAAVPALTELNASTYVKESMNRPVLVLLCSALAPQCADVAARVPVVVAEFNGALALVTVDVDAEPGIAEAFQVQAVPAMLALVGGRPVPLFQGSPDDAQLRDLFGQVVEVARQSGMDLPAVEAVEGERAAPELPPLHQEAYDAIERDDLVGALAAYDKALRENPRDADARAGRAQVALIQRSRDLDPVAARAAAASPELDLDAHLSVADIDLLGGKVDDAFGRLLDLVAAVSGADRDRIRARLVEYFDVVGAADDRVAAARKRLASALY